MKRLHLIYFIWFCAGYVLIVTDLLPSWLQWANSVYLILSGLTALFWVRERIGSRRTVYFFVLCGGLSWLAEWIGVHTGMWFGTYIYTDSFAPYVFDVPLAIPFAWCMIIIISRWVIPSNRFIGLVLSATCAVAIDFLLDPVAVVQSYWGWEYAGTWALYGVPWTNFASWWVTAFVILWITNRLFPQQILHNELSLSLRSWKALKQQPVWLLLVTLELLFITIALQHQLWLAILINLAMICGLFVARMYLIRKMKLHVMQGDSER